MAEQKVGGRGGGAHIMKIIITTVATLVLQHLLELNKKIK